jgi:homoserine dehydrogenase
MSDAPRAIRIGLLGCGTVGGGVVRLLHANAASFAARVGAPIEIARVLVRSKEKERVGELDRSLLTTDADAVLGDPSIDVFVEVMGGVSPARAYIERALGQKKSVVTANKMLLAEEGPALIERAQRESVDLAFEGSVGGGIPVVRVLRDAFASDRMLRLIGIVNGTSNYILTAMSQGGLAFGDALADAQRKGYAEADPTLDVGGHDAAHKLAILALVAFGARVPGAIATEGVDKIDARDHQFASRFGYVIKHVAIARRTGEALELRVHPALLARGTTLAHVDGVLNAIALEGEALGPCILSGRGAGDMPTAVSVVSDILDVARAERFGAAGLLTRGLSLSSAPLLPMESVVSRYYLRFAVKDRPGVLARVARALGDRDVSIEQVVQERPAEGIHAPVQIVMLTHRAVERDVQHAIREIAQQDFLDGVVQLIRVED